ncbi:MAG: alpha/beta hydrolase [Bacteroidetes bacterium]|nr:alpha/beta hydrolase [Bacteroidota bacterium]
MKRLSIVATLVFCLTGCFDMDSSLFNNTELTAYSLSTAVIPAAQRQEVVLSSQGKRIYGYFVSHPDTTQKNVILYNHGNRDHLQFYWDRVELFYAMGFSVFIYDYRGYGKSEGESSEEGIYADAQAASEYVRITRSIPDSLITVYGFSLGGAPATHLAANVFTPRRFILEAAFASASALTQSGTMLDVPGTFFMKGVYDNAGKIGRVKCPVMILHGTDDTFIDLEKNGRVLYNKAPAPKHLIAVPGAGHSNVPSVMGTALYRTTVRDFILN